MVNLMIKNNLLNVYLETTIPSYLAAYPSRDLIIAAHQQITSEWWQTAKDRFNLFISEAVLYEIRSGDLQTSLKRVELVKDIPILELNEDVQSLVQHYDKKLGLFGKAKADIPHFAYAVAYNMDYLVTWNCSHIANGEIIRRLFAVNSSIGRSTPIIVTPEEILNSLGDENYDKRSVS
jgi:hypothetical protein